MPCSLITVLQNLVARSARGRATLIHISLWHLWCSACQIEVRAINERCYIIVRCTRFALIRRLGGFRSHLIFGPSICFIPNVTPASSGNFFHKCPITNLIRRLQATPAIFQALLALLLSLLSICLTAPLSAAVSCIYAATLVAVTFVAPGVLMWAQKYKKCALLYIQPHTTRINILCSEIRGPWDVAVPKVN
jgi:hypothetical protein